MNYKKWDFDQVITYDNELNSINLPIELVYTINPHSLKEFKLIRIDNFVFKFNAHNQWQLQRGMKLIDDKTIGDQPEEIQDIYIELNVGHFANNKTTEEIRNSKIEYIKQISAISARSIMTASDRANMLKGNISETKLDEYIKKMNSIIDRERDTLLLLQQQNGESNDN